MSVSRKSLVFETLALMVNNFGGMLIGLLGTVLITRALGPEARGIYAWIFTVFGLAAQLAILAPYNSVRQMGSVKGLLPNGRLDDQQWPTLMGVFVVLALLGWMLTLPAFGWAFSQPVGHNYWPLLVVVWVSIPISTLMNNMSALVHVRRELANMMIPSLLPRVLMTALMILGWWLGVLSLNMAVGMAVLLTGLGFLFFYAWLDIPLVKWRFDRVLLRRMAKFIGASWLAGLAAFAMPKMPILLLPHYASLTDVGHFSIAATLLDVALMVPGAVSAVLISHFTRVESNRAAKRHALLALLVVLAGMAVVGYGLAPWIIPFVFGPSFVASVEPFRLLLIALLLTAPLTLMTSDLTARAHAKGLLIPPFVALAASCAGAWVWIPAHGMMGAAWAIVLGYAVQLVATLAVVRFSR